MKSSGFFYARFDFAQAYFNMMSTKTLKIALQKSGRLQEDSLKILKECGININNGLDTLTAGSTNFPVEALYLRNNDIVSYMADGVCDATIIGYNTLVEKKCTNLNYMKLGFSRCRVAIAVPKPMKFNSIQDLNGLRVATSYPETLQEFFDENNIKAEIHYISGSVEIAPNIGIADAICDIVSSGSTLFRNGLKEVHTLFNSEACLVSRADLEGEALKTFEELSFRLETVLRAKKSKYILLNCPNDSIARISSVLPVLKSPTIMPLAEEGWSSLHSVIDADDFWPVIGKIKKLGGRDILVVPIEKMVV
jgi:ATP phosphoribosyltransferase